MPEIQFYPIDFTYKDGILLFGRTEKNERIVVKDPSIKPYFYANFVNNEKISERTNSINIEGFKVIKTEINIKENKELIKIIVNLPEAVKEISNLVKEFPDCMEILETDIPIIQRYLIDKKIMPLTLCKVEGLIIKPET